MLVAALALLLVASVSFVANYEPLRFLGGGSGVDAHVVARQFDAYVPTGESFTQVELDHHPGQTFFFAFDVTNDGPLPVTITHIGPSNDNTGPYRISGVRLGPPVMRADTYSRGASTPFQPFALPGHAMRYVWIDAEFVGCLQRSTGAIFGTMPMTFTVFGVTRQTEFVMPMTIVISGTADPSCP